MGKGKNGITLEDSAATRIDGETAVKYQKLSVEAKKRNKRERLTINHILSMSIREGEPIAPEAVKSLAEANGLNISVEMAMYLVQVKQAINGSTRAWLALMEYNDKRLKRSLELEQLALEVEKMRLEIDALKREKEEAENAEAVQVIIDV